ncbi:DUF4012 domain-containing protein [Thermophilibacter sp.]
MAGSNPRHMRPSTSAEAGAPRIERGTGQGGAGSYSFDMFQEGGSSKGGPSRRRKKKRHVGRVIAIIVAVLVVALGVSGALLVRSAMTVKNDAQAAVSLAQGVKDRVAAGNFDSLSSDLQRLDELCQEMKSEVDGPLWQAATLVPVYGSDVSAARTLVGILSDVSSDVLAPMADDLSGAPSGGLISDGAVNVPVVTTMVSALASGSDSLRTANDQVRAIGETHISQLTDIVATLKDGLPTISGLADTCENIAPVLPQVLGADGQTRSYLIVAENNAEIRSLGGFSGAAGILTVTDGAISLEGFESTQTLAAAGGPTSQIQISAEEMQLFQPDGETLNYTAGDSFFIPDFPRGAQLSQTIWAINHSGQMVDGVIAVDPVFLQYLLGVVGGVTASDGTQVDGTNAAKVLLSDVYWHYPTEGKVQDEVFASVASATFDKLVSDMNGVDLSALMDAVSRGASEGRLLVWMQNDDEEAAVRSMGVDGALPTDPADPQTGVYVNNYSYSKLDWYLDLDVQRGDAVRNADGTTSYSMTATLTNTMTADEAANLPAYVRAHAGGVGAAQEKLRLYLYAPAGGSISDVAYSGGSMSEGTHNGLQVMYADVLMNPGESSTVTYTVTVPAEGANQDLRVHVTPTAQEAREGTAA